MFALAIDPSMPSTLYGGTQGGGVVKSTDGARTRSACVGDCDASSGVTIDEVVTLVNIALGDAEPSVCPNGVPSGTDVTVSVIIQAVNNALNGCAA